MKYGIVRWNVTDLRAAPKFKSERKSQLLYNETVTITQIRMGYLRVYQDDGYNGWIDERAIRIVSRNAWLKCRKSYNYIITSKTAVIRSNIKRAINLPLFLFYGTKLAVKLKTGNQRLVEFVPGENFKIPLSKCEKMAENTGTKNAVKLIIRDARRFLGVPYLWGGSTPFGFDCSGLVQVLYARIGKALPRDSVDQRKAGFGIDRDNIKAGDLLFFSGHVAIALGRRRIIHSSMAEGGVAINSLDPDSDGFRSDLYDSYIEARRILK